MKLTLNKMELIGLNACKEGLEVFEAAHGDKNVTLSQLLESNGWDDMWWYILEAYTSFSQKQKDDLNLLGCDWAEAVLTNFESEHPEDLRPRLAINASRDCINGSIGLDKMSDAWAAARSAARSAVRSSARSAAESAAWAAAWLATEPAAGAAAWLAAMSAAGSAARSSAESAQKGDLMNLFLKWESDL